MKPGDLVRNKNSESGDLGLFLGFRTFEGASDDHRYTCAEVMWFDRVGRNSDRVLTIQKNLLEVVNEKG